MSEELQEIHEHAHEAHQDPGLAPVTVTMAVLAVLVAAASLLGHRAHTEELLLATRSADQWAYYQAKNIRRHSYELFLDMLSISEPKDAARAEKLRQQYQSEIDRYKGEQRDLETEARKLEDEAEKERRRGDRYDLGEVSLECALVISSITLLTRRGTYWRIGLVLGAAGLAVAVTGMTLK